LSALPVCPSRLLLALAVYSHHHVIPSGHDTPRGGDYVCPWVRGGTQNFLSNEQIFSEVSFLLEEKQEEPDRRESTQTLLPEIIHTKDAACRVQHTAI
jgi:hypothetical protein